jgi:hypothetical protein
VSVGGETQAPWQAARATGGIVRGRFSLALVENAERTLWEPEGTPALDYLRGRGLADSTIRSARLGVIIRGGPGIPAGITIPWFDGLAPRMVDIRR